LLLIQQILQPLIESTGSYTFDEAAFDTLYRRFEDGFGAEQVHLVEFLPLNGFESNGDAAHDRQADQRRDRPPRCAAPVWAARR
jgi:hypothetical protein